MSSSSGPGQRWAEAWSAHDVEALARLFTEDCEYDGRPPGGGRFRVRGVTIFEFEGERIRRCADYWNLGDVHTQLETSSRA